MLSTAERTWILMVEYRFRMMVKYNLLVSQVYDSILFGVKIKSVKKVKKVDYPTIFQKAKITAIGDGWKKKESALCGFVSILPTDIWTWNILFNVKFGVCTFLCMTIFHLYVRLNIAFRVQYHSLCRWCIWPADTTISSYHLCFTWNSKYNHIFTLKMFLIVLWLRTSIARLTAPKFLWI